MDDKLGHVREEGIESYSPPSGAIRVQAGSHVCAIHVPCPRDLRKVEKMVLWEAGKLGKEAVYSWTVETKEGPKPVEGPTIKLAMSMYRLYTNAALTIRLVEETPESFLVEAIFVDLEAGTTYPALFRQHKSKKGRGKMDIARQEDIDFQIAISKASRNAICRGIPFWVTNDAIIASKEREQEKIKGAPRSEIIRLLLEDYTIFRVDREMIERRIGARLEDATDDQIGWLRRTHQALDEQMTSVNVEFGNGDGKKKKNGNGEINLQAMIKSFIDIGIEKDAIEKRIEVTLEKATKEQLLFLRGIYADIRKGKTTGLKEFPMSPPEPVEPPEQPKPPEQPEPEIKPEVETVIDTEAIKETIEQEKDGTEINFTLDLLK